MYKKLIAESRGAIPALKDTEGVHLRIPPPSLLKKERPLPR